VAPSFLHHHHHSNLRARAAASLWSETPPVLRARRDSRDICVAHWANEAESKAHRAALGGRWRGRKERPGGCCGRRGRFSSPSLFAADLLRRQPVRRARHHAGREGLAASDGARARVGGALPRLLHGCGGGKAGGKERLASSLHLFSVKARARLATVQGVRRGAAGAVSRSSRARGTKSERGTVPQQQNWAENLGREWAGTGRERASSGRGPRLFSFLRHALSTPPRHN
jgi:hypothetical protein